MSEYRTRNQLLSVDQALSYTVEDSDGRLLGPDCAVDTYWRWMDEQFVGLRCLADSFVVRRLVEQQAAA